MTMAAAGARRALRLRIAGAAATGSALVVLAGRDGSPAGRIGWILASVLMTGSVVAVAGRAGRRWRGAALCGLGIVGTAVGAGIAPAWITKAGLGAVSIGGVVALAGGLAALVLGSLDLGGTLAGWRRVASLTLVLVMAVLLVFSLGIAVAATNVPPTGLGETPADRGLAYEEARFATEDGVALSGWYLPSRNRAAVVLLHGAGSTRSAVLDHAAVLAAHGYGVLLVDARGHGGSDGRAMDFGWYGDLDVGAAVTHLEGRGDVDATRIGAVGLSMGGEQAIGAAGSDERLRAVVAEGATGRTAGDKEWLSEEHGIRGWLQERIDDLTYWFTDLLTAAEPPATLRDAAARMTPRPLLLITAEGVPDEAAAARFIASGAPGSVEIWEVPGAGHTGGLAVAGPAWSERVIGFLDDALLGGG